MFHENWGFHSLFLQIFFLTRIINSTTKKKRGRKEEKRGRKEMKGVRRKKRERRKKGRLEQKTKDKEKLLKEARGLIILPIEEQR